MNAHVKHLLMTHQQQLITTLENERSVALMNSIAAVSLLASKASAPLLAGD